MFTTRLNWITGNFKPNENNMIDPNTVYLFWSSLDLPEGTIKLLSGILNEEEKKRADRFRFPHLKRRFIAAHGVLRLILGEYTGMAPEKIDFAFNDRGKPGLETSFDNTSLFFNLSHSNDTAFYGLARDRHIGVDIEHIRPLSDMASIAERFFSKQEFSAIQKFPENFRNQAFFTFWTLKEAYLKAIGQGLVSLQQIEIGEIHSSADDFKIFYHDAEGNLWSLYSLSIVPGYASALAVDGEASVLPCRQWIVEV